MHTAFLQWIQYMIDKVLVEKKYPRARAGSSDKEKKAKYVA